MRLPPEIVSSQLVKKHLLAALVSQTSAAVAVSSTPARSLAVMEGSGGGRAASSSGAASNPSGRNSLDAHLPGMGGCHISSLPGAQAIKRLVSKKKLRFTKDGFDLDLSYITPRLIAMGYPSTGAESFYRNPATQVQAFIEHYHAGRRLC